VANLAVVQRIKQRQGPKQYRFAGTRWADDANPIALPQLKCHVA
jgi:hypothetical protein